jgi:RNA polymerase sigma factor for flagellar operon FliA
MPPDDYQESLPLHASQPVDATEREKLLTDHLPEVAYIARRIHSRLPGNISLEDLVQAGVIGLIDAVDKFDPLKRVQLKSYAKFRIQGAILDSLRASDWSPRSLLLQARRVEQARRDIFAVTGRPASQSELAEYVGMDLQGFQQLLGQLRGLDVSSLQLWGTENQSTNEFTTEGAGDSQGDPFVLCLQGELKSHLAEAFEALEKRQREVLTLYYSRELTMKEVAEILGIGESRVSQIHSAAMVRLRDRMELRLKMSAIA